MSAVLHLLTPADAALAPTVIGQQLAAGDRVTVVLLPGAAAPALPAAVTVRRVPDDLSYAALLELVFASDHVMTW